MQASAAAGNQTFVFGHKDLLGGSHKDNLFGAPVDYSDPGDGGAGTSAGDAKRAAADAFITGLADNHVHYYICGHDHHHYDSVVASPLNPGKSVHQVISQSDSSKFYAPARPFSANDTPVSQQLEQIGFYIYTVDGPRVTVDYYAAPATAADSQGKTIADGGSPVYSFAKQLTFGYSLNGKEFLVTQQGSYNVVRDGVVAGTAFNETYKGTKMAILDGINASRAATSRGKALTKAVDTGWAPATGSLRSDILTIWGMSDIGASQTDTFTLSMSFDSSGLSREQLARGECCIVVQDASGRWTNAVEANAGGSKQFHAGPWDSSCGLGAYGYDAATGALWAVVNHDGQFAVAEKAAAGAAKDARPGR